MFKVRILRPSASRPRPMRGAFMSLASFSSTGLFSLAGGVAAGVGPAGSAVNVAVTPVASLSVIVHSVAVPEHAPLQPAKVEPAAGAAPRVTTLPGANESL